MLRSNTVLMSACLVLCVAFIPKQYSCSKAELQLAICTGVAATTHCKASAKDCGLNASICPACLGFTLAAALVCHSLPQDGVWGGNYISIHICMNFMLIFMEKKSFHFS